MTGRTVLVTGGSSGIGREVGVLLAELGASVVLVGRDRDRLRAALDELDGGPHLAEECDLADGEAIPAWIREVAGRSGPIDGMAHCAGIDFIRPVRLTSAAQVDNVMRVNVASAVALTRGFRQRNVRRGDGAGSVVFVSSATGLVGEPGRSVYSASKAALHGLTRSLAMELAAESIRVNCVAPGVVGTPMWERARGTFTAEQAAAIEHSHPLGIGTVRDVANAVVFLLADTARWITGAVLPVDGGYSAGRS